MSHLVTRPSPSVRPLTTKYLTSFPSLNGIIKIYSEFFSSPWNPIFSRLPGIIIIVFHFQAGPQEIRAGMYWDNIVKA